MKAATEKEEIHSTCVHLAYDPERIKLVGPLRATQNSGLCQEYLGWSECGHCGKSKVRQNALMASEGYLSFDVLSTAMTPGNWRKIICDAGSVGYVPSSEF
jgi:hypothetical protein